MQTGQRFGSAEISMARKHSVSRTIKIEFLTRHYDRLKLGKYDVGRKNQHDEDLLKHRHQIVEEMKLAGLISEKTFWADVNVRRLIQDVRQRIEQGREAGQRVSGEEK